MRECKMTLAVVSTYSLFVPNKYSDKGMGITAELRVPYRPEAGLQRLFSLIAASPYLECSPKWRRLIGAPARPSFDVCL